MQLFSFTNQILEPIKQENFSLEKHIQNLTENNLETLFGLSFIETEFSIHNFRFDTVAFDDESHSFVIIEYKRGSSYSVVDQGLSYLAELLGNKADFVLLPQEKTGKNFKKEDIDWSQTRVIFIAESFNIFQKNSINFQGLPIELWEIKKFANNTISITQIKAKPQSEHFKALGNSKSEKSSKNFTKNLVDQEIKVYTEDYHLKGGDEKTIELYETLKEKILEFNSDFELKFYKNHIGFFLNGKRFMDIVLYKQHIHLWIKIKKWELEQFDFITDISSKTRTLWNYNFKIDAEADLFQYFQALYEAYKIFIK